MDRLRSIAGIGKRRRLTREGVPVHRPSSPHSPESGQAPPPSGEFLALPPPPPTPYPFGARLRLNSDMKERERKFKKFVVVSPIFPDIQALKDLMILDEIRDYFMSSGLGFVFGEHPGVYEEVVKEFCYSFKPTYHVVGKHSSDSGSEEKYVVEWNFRMGGKDFTCSEDDLLRAFGLESDRRSFPYASKETKNKFWRMITKKDVDFKPSQLATKIEMPIWKFIHRFIATCIYLRKDGGRWVNSDDIDIMCCMYERVRFNPLIVITKALEECNLPSYRGTYLGGGHFVTMVGRFVGFSFDEAMEMPKKFLGIEEMIHRGFVKNIKDNGSWTHFLVGRDRLPGEHSPPPSPRVDIGGSSSNPFPSGSYDEVLRRLGDLTTYTYEVASWQGSMMSGLYDRMGYDGYVSPPRPSFWEYNTGGVNQNEDFGARGDYSGGFEEGGPSTAATTGLEEEDAEEEDDDDDDDDGDDSGSEDDFIISHRSRSDL